MAQLIQRTYAESVRSVFIHACRVFVFPFELFLLFCYRLVVTIRLSRSVSNQEQVSVGYAFSAQT